jgi:hypothetical protein
MLGKNSFFRKTPSAIGLEQRLIFEAAGWAIEMISWSNDRLKSAAARIDPNSKNFPSLEAREMFACAWSIVDQTHMLRELLKRLETAEAGPTLEFIEKYEAASDIRNKMNHLHQNIPNLANKKSAVTPVFGALSFCMARTGDEVAAETDPVVIKKECWIISISAGALTHPKHRIQVVNPAGRLVELPVGLIEFEVFERTLNFWQMETDLRALVEHYDTVIKPKTEAQLRAFARENGLDEENTVNEHKDEGIMIIGTLTWEG